MTDRRPSWAELDAVLSRLPADLRGIARDLLMYKALVGSDLFAAFAQEADSPEEASVLEKIQLESIAEAAAALEALEGWAATRVVPDGVADRLRVRMLTDILHVKESTTEAFLLAGMRAPTNELRLEFVRLADIDRKHADALRDILGTPRVGALQAGGRLEGREAGVYAGRGDSTTFSQRVTRALDELRADGQECSGIVMSPVALRHARDEGLLGPEDGTALGLQVEIDFGWRGECFAIVTRERVRLAEIIAARSA